jgi:hypothetical protein
MYKTKVLLLWSAMVSKGCLRILLPDLLRVRYNLCIKQRFYCYGQKSVDFPVLLLTMYEQHKEVNREEWL